MFQLNMDLSFPSGNITKEKVVHQLTISSPKSEMVQSCLRLPMAETHSFEPASPLLSCLGWGTAYVGQWMKGEGNVQRQHC